MILVNAMSHEISVTYSTDSFYTMESSEFSPTTSQQARILLQKRRIGAPNSPRVMNIHQAYQPSVRRVSRPYHPLTHPRLSEVTETVRNAKRDKVKALESELGETRHKLNELLTENRTQQLLLRRQEVTLKHYEKNENSLPQILQTHEEDLRILKTNLIQEKRNTRELEQRLKSRDNELLPLRDKCSKLEKLVQDHKLGERAKLTEEVEKQKEIIKEQAEKITYLTRRVMLEKKNLTVSLEREQRRRCDSELSLASALATGERLRQQLEDKQKFITMNAFRFAGQRRYKVGDTKESLSMVSLGSSFPGLDAQMKADHELVWISEELREGDDNYLEPEPSSHDSVKPSARKASQRPSVSYPSLANLNTSYPSVANLDKKFTFDTLKLRASSPRNPEEKSSFELPDISANSVRSSTTEFLSKEDSSGDDSLADGLDPEIQRIEAAGSLTNGFMSHDNSRTSYDRRSSVDRGMKTPESLVAMEERTATERERSLQLRGDLDSADRITIDEVKKERLLAALKDIDRGGRSSPMVVKTEESGVNPRAGLIRELFGSPKLGRNHMIEQLEQMTMSDGNNNDMPTGSGRF